MAVTFDLVVDFMGDKQSADICRQWLDARIAPIKIGQHDVVVHAPFVAGYPHENPTNYKLSVTPAKIGYGFAWDDRLSGPRICLTDVELTNLGNSLYDLLRGAPNFQLAMVGVNVDFFLDVAELNSDWCDEIRDGSFDGLVVENSLIGQLPQSSHFVAFDDEHLWIPYAGSKAF